MTDEQIKQNAKDFAINETGGLAVKYYPCERGYIAGAHSRDEEIKELEKKVSALETIIVAVRAAISTQEPNIKEFRNPWISMEKLPIEGQDVLICLHNGAVIRDVFVSAGDISHMKRNREHYKCWIPTPKPKGREK